MPNIRAQIVGPLGDKAPSSDPDDQVGIYIQASDGREVTLTKGQLRARYVQEKQNIPRGFSSGFSRGFGNRTARRAAAVAWIKSQITAALGSEQVDLSMLDSDFDHVDGTPLRSVITSVGL